MTVMTSAIDFMAMNDIEGHSTGQMTELPIAKIRWTPMGTVPDHFRPESVITSQKPYVLDHTEPKRTK